MIVGIVIGVVAGLLIGLIALMIFDECVSIKYKTQTILTWLIAIAIWATSTTVGCAVEHYSSVSYVESYKATKSTIEESIKSESLTGFERAELVKEIAEKNGELAKKKNYCKHWFGVCQDKEIIDLEYIEID